MHGVWIFKRNSQESDLVSLKGKGYRRAVFRLFVLLCPSRVLKYSFKISSAGTFQTPCLDYSLLQREKAATYFLQFVSFGFWSSFRHDKIFCAIFLTIPTLQSTWYCLLVSSNTRFMLLFLDETVYETQQPSSLIISWETFLGKRKRNWKVGGIFL